MVKASRESRALTYEDCRSMQLAITWREAGRTYVQIAAALGVKVNKARCLVERGYHLAGRAPDRHIPYWSGLSTAAMHGLWAHDIYTKKDAHEAFLNLKLSALPGLGTISLFEIYGWCKNWDEPVGAEAFVRAIREADMRTALQAKDS